MAVGNGNRKEQFEQLDGVIAQWKGVEGGLLPIMQHAQEILGCVDEEVQHYISAATGIPVSTIYGVATFYSQFTLKPRGKYTMGICLGTACYVKGADKILAAIEEKLGIKSGECTPDGLFSIDSCRCVGACGLAPVMMVDDEVYGKMTVDQVDKILDKYIKKGGK